MLRINIRIFIAIFVVGMSHERGDAWKKWTKFELVDDDGEFTLQCLNSKGESVGTLTFVLLPSNPKIDIHIDTKVKGQGVGEALIHHFLTAIITQSRFRYIKSVELVVLFGGANETAVGLYLKKGFAWKEKDEEKRNKEKNSECP
ncbi:hypothetical protein DdX_16763 [Ditylenchus destructor]|uniref:N-acetyltransferase domain-containing protein n=1 Tax=Ditylenchus destructor TaxID=166010 RepID=A0AAD4MPU6_9BILA|nr:hypothetical protein DdX_16763 [Ditylenchus destructor]